MASKSQTRYNLKGTGFSRVLFHTPSRSYTFQVVCSTYKTCIIHLKGELLAIVRLGAGFGAFSQSNRDTTWLATGESSNSYSVPEFPGLTTGSSDFETLGTPLWVCPSNSQPTDPPFLTLHCCVIIYRFHIFSEYSRIVFNAQQHRLCKMNAPLFVMILERCLVPFLWAVYPDGHRFIQDKTLSIAPTMQEESMKKGN